MYTTTFWVYIVLQMEVRKELKDKTKEKSVVKRLGNKKIEILKICLLYNILLSISIKTNYSI